MPVVAAPVVEVVGPFVEMEEVVVVLAVVVVEEAEVGTSETSVNNVRNTKKESKCVLTNFNEPQI